jgi:hypothetical protein
MTDPRRPRRAVWICPGRTVAASTMLLGTLGILAGSVSGNSAATWLIKVVGPSFSVGIVPGVLILLAWRPIARLPVAALASLGFGVSFGLIQALTVVAVSMHRDTGEMLTALYVVSALHGIAAVVRRRGTAAVIHGSDVLLGCALFGVAAFAYLQGAPFQDTEDQIHAAIVRRLLYLDAPSLDNIYSIYAVPPVIYTYPFPGTHYLMALIARAGGLDPLFVYHKLRAFWVVIAVLTLYGFVNAVFGSRRLALVSALTGIAFIANGTFGTVRGFFWGQLEPVSHASDVALGVVLPALLLLACYFIKAERPRGQTVFLCATVMLGLALTAVHTRDVVQLIVYLAAFVGALVIIGRSRAMWHRAALLLGTLAAALLVWSVWHGATADAVGRLVVQRRPDLIGTVSRYSWTMLFGQPHVLLSDYVSGFSTLFYGWTPIVVLVAPFALYQYRHRPLTLLIGASVLSYLIIIRVPIVALTYVWGTYFEILYSPVRNIVFFVHALTGAAVYTIACRLAHLRPVLGVASALAVSAVAVLVFHFGAPAFTEWIDLLFVPAIAGYLFVLYRLWSRSAEPVRVAPSGSSWWTAIVAVLIVVPAALFTWMPETSPVASGLRENVNTPTELFAGISCEPIGGVSVPFVPSELAAAPPSIPLTRSCPPSVRVMQFAAERMSPQAIFVADKFARFPPPAFMPQRVVAWPSADQELISEQDMFVEYYRYYRARMIRYGVQPFFNDRESRAERVDFISHVGATHVLVDPGNHETMARVLRDYPDLFRPVFDEGGWAIYEIVRARLGNATG